MKDYKELIETLRNGTKSPLHVAPNGFMAFDVSVVNAIADVIEQLVKERDAAVADFNQFAIYAASTESFACEWCKHERGGGRCQWFTDHKDDKVCRGVHFEWRGVREDGE